MSLQHIQKNSPRLLPKPAKFEKKPPNGYRVIRKTKCRAGSSPIHKQASLTGRLTRPTHRRTDANLYPQERQLTKASEQSVDLEGGAKGQI